MKKGQSFINILKQSKEKKKGDILSSEIKYLQRMVQP